jgi:hypothetical protein
MSKYPFTYTIQGYDYEDEKYYLESGIGICESFADAANILDNRYKSELIAVKHLELYEEDNVITLPTEVFEKTSEALNACECWCVPCNEKGVKII